jgi:nucleotide-binding universal stress UspA family protein
MIEFNINRILVPVDFGPASINALDSAIALAKLHGATILLLNVMDTSVLPDFTGDTNMSGDVVNALAENSEQELKSLQDSIIETFLLPCEAITISGFVSTSIIKVSARHQVDLIVMGTQGASGHRDFFIGSNAYNVVKNSVCPVLTIPPEKKWESFKKILFPVRPIPFAIEKYDFVRKIIRKNDAKLKILGLASDYEKEVDVLKDLAAQLKEKLKDDEVEASAYFKVGKNMADEVLKIAALMDADMIVITATIDSSFKQFLIGPYTQYIINHSRFPVLSVRPSSIDTGMEEVQQQSLESFV